MQTEFGDSLPGFFFSKIPFFSLVAAINLVSVLLIPKARKAVIILPDPHATMCTHNAYPQTTS